MYYKPKENVSYNLQEKKDDAGEVIGNETIPHFEIADEQAIIDWYISSHPEMVAERFSIQGAPEDHAFSMILQYDEEALGILSDTDINLGLDQDFKQPRGNVLETNEFLNT